MAYIRLPNGQTVQSKMVAGREVITFTADRDFDEFSLLSECMGDSFYNTVQLEEGTVSTPFVQPEVIRTELSGLFKLIHGLNLEMTDVENSALWSRIRQNASGMLEKYHNETAVTAIAKSAEGLSSKLSSLDEKIDSQYIQLLDKIALSVSSDQLQSILQLSGDSILQAIRDRGGDLKTVLNLDEGGIKLKGDIISLDGATFTKNFTAEVAKLIELDAGSITTGKLKADIFDADAITSKNIKSDTALIDKLFSANANIAQLFSKTGFITRLQSVDFSATQIKGGILKSLNGKLAFDLNNSVLNTFSNTSAIRRVSDNQSQFLKMAYEDGTTLTTIGANRKADDESIGTADFTGIQIVSRGTQKGYLRDKIVLYGDEIRLNGGGGTSDGLYFKNNQWLRPETSGRFYLGMDGYRWREVHSNDYYINGVVLSTYLKSIRACLTRLMNGGATQSTYDYIKGQVTSVLNKLP